VANDTTEVQQAKKWIYDALHGNSDIAAAVSTRIYSGRAPGSPASRVFPYIIFNFQGGTNVNGLGTVRLLARPLFQVRVVTKGDPTAAVRKVDKRIDDVLGTAVYQPSGDYYFTAEQEQPIDREETDLATGDVYWNLGGLYRLYIGRTP
jgi:hypothetical protein